MISTISQLTNREAITPWDVETQPNYHSAKEHHLNILVRRKISFKDLHFKTKKSVVPKIMKLQARKPIQFVIIERDNPENVHSSRLLDRPKQFNTFPPKKMSQRTQRPMTFSKDRLSLKEKVSTSIFKKDIEQLTKLSYRNVSSCKQIPKNQSNKKNILKNIDVGEQLSPNQKKIISLDYKISVQSKKHVLDRILSRFQS